MTKREDSFCYDLSRFMCYPSSFEIGGASEQLKDAILNITRKNKSIRNKVFEYCEFFVEEGQYNSNIYESADKDKVLEMIKEDYDKVFY